MYTHGTIEQAAQWYSVCIFRRIRIKTSWWNVVWFLLLTPLTTWSLLPIWLGFSRSWSISDMTVRTEWMCCVLQYRLSQIVTRTVASQRTLWSQLRLCTHAFCYHHAVLAIDQKTHLVVHVSAGVFLLFPPSPSLLLWCHRWHDLLVICKLASCFGSARSKACCADAGLTQRRNSWTVHWSLHLWGVSMQA